MKKTGAQLILEERSRQMFEEGWTEEGDDKHNKGELSNAALAYLSATPTDLEAYEKKWISHSRATAYWPWDKEWWKPKDRMRNLIRAGALIAAEIDRLQRLQDKDETKQST